MTVHTWYPYAPDQAFGAEFAAREELLDRLIETLDANFPVGPRTRAAPGPPQVVRPRVFLWAGADEGPVTTATALDAAPELWHRR
jgi:hypothetical protein